MKRERLFVHAVTLQACCSLFLALAAPAAAADDRKGEEEVKPLIVMVRSALPSGDEEVGAGIIFGQRGSSLYVLTANHVVRQGAQDATGVRVRFRWLPGEDLEARLLADADAQLDWAVLKVENVDVAGLSPDGLPFARLGEPSALQRGDRVFLIGNPTGHSWDVSVTPDSVTDNTASSIFFESVHLEPGHSGGALLDENRRVVGLLKSSQAPHGEAVNISAVLSVLASKGYPVSLARGVEEPQVVMRPSPTPAPAEIHERPQRALPQRRPLPHPTLGDWEGSWDLQFEFPQGQWHGARMTLRADQSGITGSYDFGRITGSFVEGDISQVLGKYTNTTGTGQTCASGEQAGQFAFNLTSDGQAMDGWWDLCAEGTKFRWRAIKKSGAAGS